MPRIIFTAVFLGLATASAFAATDSSTRIVSDSPKLELELGPRPAALIAGLAEGGLKNRLEACAASDQYSHPQASEFSISHRGAPLQFPEHTREGYIAAANMGAGIIECDVTFTKDKALVCRHSQCDLHTTTNILSTPLAASCSTPPDSTSQTPYRDVQCCASDITLSEFKSLQGKFDKGDKKASTLEGFYSLVGTPREPWQDRRGTLMTHRESIELFRSLGVKMIPELKQPQVPMPFNGDFSQSAYAKSLLDEYQSENIPVEDVWLQSFQWADIKYWLDIAPQYSNQTAWLDGRYRDRSFNPSKPDTWKPSMQELADSGLKILAPPLWVLLSLDNDDNIVSSPYAIAAKAAGLDLVTWTLERSGSLENGGGWYYQTIKKVISQESDMYRVLDVLAQEVKVRGVFSDWPATTTFYANCTGLK
ncbi:MAG: glycerophosphoryl diester phosphodiesterase [Granulosicoccus sp.]|jgi:glycerophosphoryl diester phosphodiesterase